MLRELNIDALVGPTHHFGGVGVGNRASATHRQQVSHPRRAALEGLQKASLVARLGVPQYILPPPSRPRRDWLTKLGFVGDFDQQCEAARWAAPAAYSATFSSAFMWAANAATFTPACDSRDNRNHLTLANLISSWHRLAECTERLAQFERLWSLPLSTPVESCPDSTILHPALPSVMALRDEGAANHMRLCDASGHIGCNVFVYGEAEEGLRPKRFPARQTLAACQAIARLHQLQPERTFFFQQHPDAIDAGIFHNDVIATSHENVLLYHERAFINADVELTRLVQTYARHCGQQLAAVCVREQDCSLDDAVASYLFNSQLLSPHSVASTVHIDRPHSMVLLCADQCQRMHNVRSLIENLIADRDLPFEAAHYVDLDESMSGGGGPACLRLRAALPHDVIDHFAPTHRLTPALEERLQRAIDETYPEELAWSRLADPDNLRQYAVAESAVNACFKAKG